jgi:hypothetical protein
VTDASCTAAGKYRSGQNVSEVPQNAHSFTQRGSSRVAGVDAPCGSAPATTLGVGQALNEKRGRPALPG